MLPTYVKDAVQKLASANPSAILRAYDTTEDPLLKEALEYLGELTIKKAGVLGSVGGAVGVALSLPMQVATDTVGGAIGAAKKPLIANGMKAVKEVAG